MSESSKTKESGTNVQVAVRCRPMNIEERKSSQPSVVTCDSATKSIAISYGPPGKKTTKSFTFDRVFGAYSRQEEVFDSVVRPIVDECLAGFNCTIFAYGQTGTGKTHTMEGDIHSEENAGIVPRSVKCILEQLESSGAEFTIRVSFLELYNEELQDLLNPTPGASDKKLKLCEDTKKGGVVCQNLEEITVLNVNDIFEILQRGIQQRQTAETLCNKNSSRSHSIFTMKIMIKECNVEGEEVVRHGQLNLVDLAGSECVGRSGAKNDRAREAGSINQSLLTLGRVITALVDHHGHVPYRDSKLTRLLQESLGGKAKTCIIATLSPSQLASEESLSTLDYAYRAKNIKNQPTVNQKMTKKVVLKEYCAEIETLRMQLTMTREKNGIYLEPQQFYDMEARISTLESILAECEGALKVRNDEYKFIKGEKEEIEDSLLSTKSRLEETLNTLEETSSALSKREDEITSLNLEKDLLESSLLETRRSLDETSSQLETTARDLSETREVLLKTQLELEASEAVVGECAETEEQMYRQGCDLQEELLTRRAEVENLFTKVDRLKASEEHRLIETRLFLSGVSAEHKQLLDTLLEVVSEGSSSSCTMINDLKELATSANVSCSSLQSSVSESISFLQSNIFENSSSIQVDSSELEHKFKSIFTFVSSELEAHKKRVGGWISESTGTLDRTGQALVFHQTKLKALSESLKTFSSSLQASLEVYLSAQSARSMSSNSEIQNLKIEIENMMGKQKQEMEDWVALVEANMREKAKEFEKTFQAHLKDLITSQTSNLFHTLSSHSSFSSSLSSLVNVKSAVLSSHLSSQFDQSTKFCGEMKEKLSQTLTISSRNAIEEMESESKAAESDVTCLSQLMSKEKEETDAKCLTIHEKTKQSESELQMIASRISNTSSVLYNTSNGNLTSMGGHLDSSLASLSSSVNDSANKLKDCSSSHFMCVEKRMRDQEQGLNRLGGEIKKENEKNDGSLDVPAGSTPKKAKFSPLMTLPKTRPHEVIRGEAQSRSQRKPLSQLSSRGNADALTEPEDSLMLPKSTNQHHSSLLQTTSTKQIPAFGWKSSTRKKGKRNGDVDGDVDPHVDLDGYADLNINSDENNNKNIVNSHEEEGNSNTVNINKMVTRRGVKVQLRSQSLESPRKPSLI